MTNYLTDIYYNYISYYKSFKEVIFYMSAEFSFSDNSMTVFLNGDIDHHSIKSLREEIDNMITQKIPEKLIMDFKNVDFMDSSGIGLVIGRFRCINELNGSLIIQNPPYHIKKVMKLAGIDKLAQITSDSME